MEYLKRVDDKEAADVIRQHCKDLRSVHRSYNRGYTKDKTMRHILKFSADVLFHPEFSKYFSVEMDPHERRKHLYKFAKDHPEHVVVDKL